MSNSASLAAAKKRRGGISQIPATRGNSKMTRNLQNQVSVEPIPFRDRSYTPGELLHQHDYRIHFLEGKLKDLITNGNEKNNDDTDNDDGVQFAENRIMNHITSLSNDIGELRNANSLLENNVRLANTTITTMKAGFLSQTNKLAADVGEIRSLREQVANLTKNNLINAKKVTINESKESTDKITCDIKELEINEEKK